MTEKTENQKGERVSQAPIPGGPHTAVLSKGDLLESRGAAKGERVSQAPIPGGPHTAVLSKGDLLESRSAAKGERVSQTPVRANSTSDESA